MAPLDRYLKAVKPFLPQARREEILGELSERLRSQLAAREAELGRPLAEAEQEAILDANGTPLQTASHYRNNYRSLAIGKELIGPELFPYYVKILCINFAITVAIFATISMVSGKVPAFRQFLLPVSIQFACVTVVFMAIDAAQRKYNVLGRWKRPSVRSTELLGRYLHAVRFWLPRTHREDILSELAEDLESKIEEREAELGHKLDQAEMAAILKQRGQPMLVASRYVPPPPLIGPDLLPAYWFVLKLAVLWILIPVHLVILGPIALRTAANPGTAAIRTFWECAMFAVFAVGLVTVVFGIMERRGGLRQEWDPRRLRPAPANAGSPGRASRYVCAAEIVMSVAFSAGWVYLIRFQPVFDFDGVQIALAPIWASLFWPMLAVTLSGAVRGVAGLVQPRWTGLRSGIRLAASGITLVLIGVLIYAVKWVELIAPALSAGVADAEKGINLGVWISLIVAALVTLADSLQEAWKLLDGRRTAVSRTPSRLIS